MICARVVSKYIPARSGIEANAIRIADGKAMFQPDILLIVK